jgi:hypothetical protein
MISSDDPIAAIQINLFRSRGKSLLSWAGDLGKYVDGDDPTKVLDRCKQSAGPAYS